MRLKHFPLWFVPCLTVLTARAGPSEGHRCDMAQQEKVWRAPSNEFFKRAARLQHDCEGSWLCPTKAGASQHHPVPPVGILEIRTNYLGKNQFSVISRNSQSSISNILEGHWLQVTCLEGRARESRHVHCEASSLRNHFRPFNSTNQWKRWSL